MDAFKGMIAVSSLPVSDILFEEYVKSWAKYDPKATNFISVEDLDNILIDLASTGQCNDLFVNSAAVKNIYGYRFR